MIQFITVLFTFVGAALILCGNSMKDQQPPDKK